MYVDSNFIIVIYLARQAACLDIPLRVPLFHLQLIQRAHLFALEQLLQPIRVLYKVLTMRLLPAAMYPVIKLERPVIIAVLAPKQATVPPLGPVLRVDMQLAPTDCVLLGRVFEPDRARGGAHERVRLLNHLEADPEGLLVAVEHLVRPQLALPLAVHLAGGHDAQEALLVVDHDDARLFLMGSGPAEGAALVGKPRHDWHGGAHEARVVDPITVVERAVEE